MPRLRFNLRRMMVAVAIVGVVLALEIGTARFARNIISEHGDGKDYLPHEASIVWAILQAPIALVAFVAFCVSRTTLHAMPPRTLSAKPPP